MLLINLAIENSALLICIKYICIRIYIYVCVNIYINDTILIVISCYFPTMITLESLQFLIIARYTK